MDVYFTTASVTCYVSRSLIFIVLVSSDSRMDGNAQQALYMVQVMALNC